MQIFLSYANEQRPIADILALALRERGHGVFLDRDDLQPGKGFNASIEEKIKESDLMVFLISPGAVQIGRYTLTELEMARKYWRTSDRKLLPVMIEATNMDQIPSFAKSVTILKPQGNVAAEVSAAVDDLRGLEYAVMTGLKVSAIALAFGLLSYFSFYQQDGKAVLRPVLPVIGLMPAPEVGLIFSIPIAFAIWHWGLRRWWAFVIPLVIVTICYGIIAPQISALTYGVAHNQEQSEIESQRAFQQISDKYHLNAPENADDKKFLDAMVERLDSLDITFRRLQHGLFSGAVMALGAMVSLALVMSQFRSVFRWLVVLVTGAVISGIDAFIVLLAGHKEFHGWQAMALILVWQVVFGALLGYWLARGRTTVSG